MSNSRILIVDDEPVNCKLMADLVTREGFEAVVANGGAEALSMLARESFTLVLLDLMMPGVGGMAVLAEMEKRQTLGPTPPVVVVTALDDAPSRRRALTAGAIDFISKPIDRTEIACKIRALVELSSLRAESVLQLEAKARSEQLAQVEAGVAGLPVIVFEVAVVAGAARTGRWLIGDSLSLIGVSREAFFAGVDWRSRLHAEDRDRVVEEHGRLYREGGSMTSRYRLDVRGTVCWRLEVSTFSLGTGVLRGMLFDIDEQVKVADQLRQAQKMEAIGKLAGGVAHDFNNILAIVVAYAGFVQDGLPEGDRRWSDAQEILNAAERGSGLTQRLLSLARQEPVAVAPVDLSDSVARFRGLLGRTLGARIELQVVPSSPVFVRVDAVQLDQVLLNLAVNARDALPDGGRLHIAVERLAGGRARLLVADSGTGMDLATQQRIFDPFFTTKPRGRGTGLGLSTVFGIVEQSGGTIRCESAPGKGTTFFVEWPTCEGPAASVPVEVRSEVLPAAPAPAGPREVVLVAEDDAALRWVTERVLVKAGYEVHVASDGTDAIRRIDELAPRLGAIVTDVMMPGCDGYAVAAHAAQVAPGAVVLLTSGYVDEASLHPAARPTIPILWKPVPPPRLVEAVAEALRKRGPKPGLAVQPGADGPIEPPVASPAQPAAPGAAPSVAAPVAARRSLVTWEMVPSAQRDRLLLVDDDAPLAAACERALQQGGFDVVVAGSLQAARRALDGGRFNVVLIDLGLPDGTGFDLLADLEGQYHATPVVMMTGAPSVESASRAVRSRVSAYLPKPFPAAELVAAARSAADAGRVTMLRSALLASRFGGDEFVSDIGETQRRFGRALSKICMAYQPIVRATDGSVFSYEALLRCDEPTLRTPQRLLAAAEVIGRVEELGLAVRAAVATTMRDHRHRADTIFVNLHPAELRADLLTAVAEPLAAFARHVVLEVTERTTLDVGPRLDAELARIRALGFRIAVDDLGQGYAGLSSLVHLRPDIAKIDISLVRDIHASPLKRDIVRALVDMAQRSGILVVAEGIETVEERDILVHLGCDLLQGYLYARPGAPFPEVRTTFGQDPGAAR